MNSPFRKFLDRQPLYLVLYGHIEALRLNQLQVSIDQAIKNFVVVYNLSDDDINIESARRAYYRMAEDLRESQKSANGSGEG